MGEPEDHTPAWLREQADRCFRLADQALDNQTRDALATYGRELLERAEKMEHVAGGEAP